MNKMIRESRERQVVLVLMIGSFFLILSVFEDVDMKTVLYSWFVVIIGVIIYNIWFNITKDYINNEEKKISFLNEEFDHLVNSVIEFEGLGRSFGIKRGEKKKIKYTVTEIIINRPRKIKKDGWKVMILMENPSHFKWYIVGGEEFSRNESFNVLNISDTELDKIITNEKKFNGLTNPIKETVSGYRILNPDVLKNSD